MQDQEPKQAFPSIQEWKARQTKDYDAALERNGGTPPESGSAFSSGFIQTGYINLGDVLSYNAEKAAVVGAQKGRELLQSLGRKISQAIRPNRTDLP